MAQKFCAARRTFPALAPVVAFEHHLRIDGTGYPDGVSRPNLNLATMLCGIADVYDAMRSQRKYQQAFPSERILAVLQRNDGKQFDQNLVRRFVQLLGIYPVGNLVKLNTGEVGDRPSGARARSVPPESARALRRRRRTSRAAARHQPLGDRAGRARRPRVFRHRSAQPRRLRNRSAVVHLIAVILEGDRPTASPQDRPTPFSARSVHVGFRQSRSLCGHRRCAVRG